MQITGKYRLSWPFILILSSCGSSADGDALPGPVGGQGGVSKNDVGQGGTVRGGAGRDARSDLSPFAQALADAGVPGPCGNCVKNQCFDSMSACADDAKCVQGFACTMMQCMSSLGAIPATTTGLIPSAGSASGLGCTLACFQNDVSAAVLAGTSATCIQNTCQTQCSSLLAGDGGREAEPDTAPKLVDASADRVSTQASEAEAAADVASSAVVDASTDSPHTPTTASDASAEASRRHR